MNLTTLSLALIFVIFAVALSNSLKLGLEKDMVWAAVRAIIQLLLIGYILTFVFKADNPVFMIVMVVLMIGAATQNVIKRGKGLRGLSWRIILTLSLVEIITMLFMVGLQIIPATPQYTIPISGMIIGSSMVISSLLLNRLFSEVRTRKSEILVYLSLGGTPKQAIQDVLREAVRTSMIPTLDSARTIGLVQLPGMMTGQIIAGADPVQAVRFQLLIVFSTMATAALTSIVLAFLIYPLLFNNQQQLINFIEE